MSTDLLGSPKLGDTVYYYDEQKQPFAAIVAYIHLTPAANSDRPICNLAIFKQDGTIKRGNHIGPARHNGTRWIMIEKYSWPDEIPDSEWKHLSPHIPGLTDFLKVQTCIP